MTKFTESTWTTALMATSKDYTEDIGGSGSFVRPRIVIDSELLRLSRLYMPEPFLWDVFHHLVEAAVAMRYGPTNGSWGGHEIVHRDIKPGNSPTPESFLTRASANWDQSSWARRTGKVVFLSFQ